MTFHNPLMIWKINNNQAKLKRGFWADFALPELLPLPFKRPHPTHTLT